MDRQPRPGLRAKKKRRDRLIAASERAGAEAGWRFGFLDECWFSRLAQPRVSAWSGAGQPVRLQEKGWEGGDRSPKALACYGLYLPVQQREPERVLARFVEGRPVSGVTCDFLEWLARTLEGEAVRVLVLFWDNASWHCSAAVRRWLRARNRRARCGGGMRLLVCPLPKKSPWLNRIEPKWVHAKRAALEPDRVLAPEELTERLCRYFRCEQTEPLKQQLS